MYSRLLTPPLKNSFFLFGPRGVGKTTWVKQNFPQALYIDLLESKVFNRLFSNPGILEEMIPEKFNNWIVIDEVQKIPQLLDEVHRLIENKHFRFVLTGSSARKLRRGGVNLLAGRAFTRFMHPLTAVELGNDFSLSENIQYGSLPATFISENKEEYLASYVQSYLQQEVVQEGISRNLPAFARFLETASFSQGSVLNMSQIAQEAMIGRRMAENYFCALEDLLIGVRLPVFSKKAKRKLVVHNKFYFFDAGIYRTLKLVNPLDQQETINGISLESVFFQNLRAINDYLNLKYSLYYYRTVSGTEVDFVAYGPKGLLAFELKSKREISLRDLRGLKTFKEDYPMAKCYLFYNGKMKRYKNGIEIWSVEEALKSLPKILKQTAC